MCEASLICCLGTLLQGLLSTRLTGVHCHSIGQLLPRATVGMPGCVCAHLRFGQGPGVPGVLRRSCRTLSASSSWCSKRRARTQSSSSSSKGAGQRTRRRRLALRTSWPALPQLRSMSGGMNPTRWACLGCPVQRTCLPPAGTPLAYLPLPVMCVCVCVWSALSHLLLPVVCIRLILTALLGAVVAPRCFWGGGPLA